MEDESLPSPWTADSSTFPFVQEIPQKIPRAWERTPKSPYGGRHGGRKVWKRYETLPKDTLQRQEVAGASPVLEDTTNTSHTAKRLRLKETAEDPAGGKENISVNYLATLNDDAKGTPRRKNAKRKSLKPDRQRPPSQPQDLNEAIKVDKVALGGTVQEDSVRASLSPALEETRELLSQSDQGSETVNEECLILNHDGSEDSDTPAQIFRQAADRTKMDDVAGSPHSDDKTTILPTPELTGTVSKREVDSEDVGTGPQREFQAPNDPKNNSPKSVNDTRLDTINADAGVSHNAQEPNDINHAQHSEESVLIADLRTTIQLAGEALPAALPASRRLPNTSEMLSPGDGSPQIGTSLLRRESLRNRETPSKKRQATNARSPKKRDTLSRRDTLQEREILKKVIAETKVDSNLEDHNTDHLGGLPQEGVPGIKSQGNSQMKEAICVESPEKSDCHLESSEHDVESARRNTSDVNIEKDIHRALEAIEVFENPEYSQAASYDIPEGTIPTIEGEDTTKISADQDGEEEAIREANEIIAKSEVDEAAHSAGALEQQTNLQPRQTRSGTRFSDDTSMLRDFLHRAQATKAAKTPAILPLDTPKPQISPRRSPRKVHGSHMGISTPRRKGDISHRPDTPPEIIEPDAFRFDNAEEMIATPTSCRRSARKRLPAPSKAAPGVPSFIPVKRADGSDPVVLAKSQAQELAMVTRANTRRNKGQSKPPLLALKDLPVDASQGTNSKQRADNGKAVGWAERLASYHDAREKKDEADDTKPRVRRMRGLGGANGTPAPKKSTAMVENSNGTPAPKRRGKMMSGK